MRSDALLIKCIPVERPVDEKGDITLLSRRNMHLKTLLDEIE